MKGWGRGWGIGVLGGWGIGVLGDEEGNLRVGGPGALQDGELGPGGTGKGDPKEQGRGPWSVGNLRIEKGDKELGPGGQGRDGRLTPAWPAL